MYFFTNKIISRALAKDHVENFHRPITDIHDLHAFYDPVRSGRSRGDNWWEDSANREAMQQRFVSQLPHGLQPLAPTEYLSREDQSKQKQHNLPWSYDPGVMENTYNRLKHTNPTHGEMAALSLMLRGWNRDASSPGGQYLQMMANEQGGRDHHEGIRPDNDYGNRTPEEAYGMREGFKQNPMHGRLSSMVGELSKQAQDEYRKQFGANGAVLHRGIGHNSDYVDSVGQTLDSGGSIPMNAISSYTPRLRSAMKFAGNRNVELTRPDIYDKVKGQAGLPDDPYDFNSYHPKSPGWGHATIHNLLSSHVKPEDVFLTNNVVGTPTVPYNGTNGNQDTLNKEQEVWVKPRADMGHAAHSWAGWYSKAVTGSHAGNSASLGVHKNATMPTNVDIPSFGRKIAHYNKPYHADSMVNASSDKIEPEPD